MRLNANDIYILATVVVALAAVFGGLRWIYKRGGTESAYKAALDSNTEATKELTGSMKLVVEKVNDHSVQLAEHNVRIKTLEAQPNVVVNAGSSPYRDASTAS